MRRAQQIGWVLRHLDDLESDFSVFHRIDDMRAMPGPKFLKYAWRIAAYDGMMARRIEAQQDEPTPRPRPAESSGGPDPTPGISFTPERPAAGRLPPGTRMVPVSALALQPPDPVMGSLIEIVRVPKTPPPDPS